jgi:hypothetical protein
MKSKTPKTIAVIVAHPDDETLWAGGTILNHPNNEWVVVCLCRASDCERALRFKNAMKILNVEGIMGDLDDGPDQLPLDQKVLETEILRLLPAIQYELIITHNTRGEYTRHTRHEEVNKAVVNLWYKQKIQTNELWTFAYEDGNKSYFPKAIESASIFEVLSENIWQIKYDLITKTYGFSNDSWEAETTPLAEAFWQFKDPHKALKLSTDFEKDIEMSKLSIFKLLYNDNYINPLKTLFRRKKKIVSIESYLNDKKTYSVENKMKTPNELRIFETPSIEILKSLYYKSKVYLIENNFDNETASIIRASRQLIKMPIIQRSIKRIKNELKIFSRSSIEALKLEYFETNLKHIK